MTDFEYGIICMLILSRCASGMAEAAHLHIYTSSHLHIFEVAVHMPGKGDSDVGNYILFPRVYTNYPCGFEGEGLKALD